MKISHKVPLLASAIILLSFYVLATVQYKIVYSTLYKTLEYNTSEFSASIADQIGNWFHGKLTLIDMMAEYIATDYSAEQIQSVMDNPLLKEEFELIFGCLQKDGKPISNTPSWFPGKTWDGRKRDWYSQARTARQAVLTTPYIDSATGKILMSVVANIKNKSLFRGAFGGDLSLETVFQTLNSVNFNQKGYAFLVDTSGTIISHPDSSFNGKVMSELFSLKTPKIATGFIETTAQDRNLLIKFTPIKKLRNTKWFVGFVLEKKQALEQADDLRRITLLVAFVTAVIASLILYFFMARLLLNPITKITATADAISLGRLDAKIEETGRNDEIGALAKAIERMGVSIKLAIEKLKKK